MARKYEHAPDEIRRRLADPFPAAAVGWKPQSVKGNRCLAVAYIDARDVMDRLDDVVGLDGWRDEYADLASGNVRCRLSLRIGGEWVPKEDVGGESDQKDAGDKCKSSHSDALKRAAVKFGVARYLYSLPLSWVDYDPAKQRIVNPPALPAWALPGGSGRPPGTAQPAPPPEEQPAAKPQKAAKPAPPFTESLQAWDEKAARQGACQPGELVKHIVEKGRAGKFGADADRWSEAEIEQARQWAGKFVKERQAPAKAS